jgi:hypothetical protein
MRCPDCNKFTGLETEHDGIDGEDVSADEHGICVTFSVTVNRNCSECGTTLKSAQYDFEETEEINWKELGVAESEIGEVEVEVDDPDVDESGGGRYKKNMIVLDAPYRVKIGEKLIYEGSARQSMAAGEFEEQV